MTTPFDDIFSKLSKERQKVITERAQELIKEQESINDCCRLIDASFGATELAVFYCQVKSISEHHDINAGVFLSAIRASIIRQAGIPSEYMDYMNEENILLKSLETYGFDLN